MTEDDKKVRKQWLILFIIGLAVSAVSYLMQAYFMRSSFSQMPLGSVGFVLISLLSQCVFAYILYHCAYKKPGTKLLLCCLILTGASVTLTPILYFLGLVKAPIPYYGAYLFLSEAMGICWTLVSWKMRGINLRLKAGLNS